MKLNNIKIYAAFLLFALASCSSDDEMENFGNSNSSPYVTRVLDYRPAPGTFVNKLPEATKEDTQESMNAKVLAAIGNNAQHMITLGSFGGYVVVGFDHTIENKDSTRDFIVLGNSFKGSSEPGVIEVALDRNKNGKPDENEWYEIAGSERNNPLSINNYSITYERPTLDSDEIKWKDSEGGDSAVVRNKYHSQNYYPLWLYKESSLTFSGTLLPSNSNCVNNYWTLDAYAYGYADNLPNNNVDAEIDIDWAIDKNGEKIHLRGVDFIKIYTGLNQQCGDLGDTSTEVLGVTDLNLINK